MNARSTALARADREIDESQQRAIAARQANESKPRTALEALASRLQVQPKVLTDTLRSTAFSACKTNEEFVALVVVANEYGLNPLLKEMYAFPAKGGGIVPMVSVDGWVRIMNEHPQFDGIEFDYIVDQKGGIEAIEAIIHRKDRGHPIKVIEYLEECRRGTEPWKIMPRRMLRNRALIQCARIAFGFSGLVSEGDEDMQDVPIARQVTRLPSSGGGTAEPQQSLAEALDDEIPAFDRDTGKVVEGEPVHDPRPEQKGMTEVDEETARKLDAGEPIEDEAEPEGENEALTLFLDRIKAAKDLDTLTMLGDDWKGIKKDFSEPEIAEVENLMMVRRKNMPARKAGDEQAETKKPSKADWLDTLKRNVGEALTLQNLKNWEAEWIKQAAQFDEPTVREIEELFATRRKELSA